MDHDFLRDPRTLSLPHRRALRSDCAADQAAWLPRLRDLAEAAIDDDFPAFLLALPPFAALGERLRGAQRRSDLPIATADELDWFVDAFADYLRTNAGEDVFAASRRAS